MTHGLKKPESTTTRPQQRTPAPRRSHECHALSHRCCQWQRGEIENHIPVQIYMHLTNATCLNKLLQFPLRPPIGLVAKIGLIFKAKLNTYLRFLQSSYTTILRWPRLISPIAQISPTTWQMWPNAKMLSKHPWPMFFSNWLSKTFVEHS